MKAWKAVVKTYEGVLNSGKDVVYSAPFERKMDAQSWMDKVVEQKEKTGEDVDYEETVVFSGLYPRKSIVKAPKKIKTVTARVIGRKSK